MRTLQPDEIKLLEANGCRCRDWSAVSVADPFTPDRYRDAEFIGAVTLGRADGSVDDCGTELPAGIYHATVADCVIGDNVRISRVGRRISDCVIGEGALIENVGSLTCSRGARFAIGEMVSILDETGSLQLPLTPMLTSNLAWLAISRRDDTKLHDAIRRLAALGAANATSDRAFIGAHARIVNAGTIRDVNIGEAAVIDSALTLTNGTIISSTAAPARIGAGVIACDFVIMNDAVVENGANLDRVFVGQGTHLRNGFSAHQSLFFANCSCENGEAAAIVAGPYTVTMHKSTLLIGAQCSFFNAGSGTNQSNHMYKLGPMHGGSMGRGCKTASGSYIMWPGRIAPFSLLIGRHIKHPDTSEFPFSFVIDNDGDTYVVPGATLRSVGTFRDFRKWPRRDRRHALAKADIIDFSMLNPMTCGLMIKAIELLDRIEQSSECVHDTYTYRGLRIKASSLERGRRLYRAALDLYFRRILWDAAYDELDAEEALLAPWTDLGGLILPRSSADSLCDFIISEAVDFSEIADRIADESALAAPAERIWAEAAAAHFYDRASFEAMMGSNSSAAMIRDLLLDDARKELSIASRDDYDSHPVIAEIRSHFRLLING